MSHRAVLMSIKPKYANLVFAGTKTIELRRVCHKIGPGDLVLVYVSSPRMALVGGFEVAGIVSDEPSKLCKKWQQHSGVDRETFLHYFQGAATAYGILIGRTWMLPAVTELKALRRTAFTGFGGLVALMAFVAAIISSSIRSFSLTGSAASCRRRSTLRAASSRMNSVMVRGRFDGTFATSP